MEQCAYEDGMVTYTRCTNPVARDGAVYCKRHAQYEPRECDDCFEETSDFQEREGTHVHATMCALDCNYHPLLSSIANAVRHRATLLTAGA